MTGRLVAAFWLGICLFSGAGAAERSADVSLAHAATRNVMVVPGLEMPGHATAAITAYPSLRVADALGRNLQSL